MFFNVYLVAICIPHYILPRPTGVEGLHNLNGLLKIVAGCYTQGSAIHEYRKNFINAARPPMSRYPRTLGADEPTIALLQADAEPIDTVDEEQLP
jgi:hypothetical protein